jgi:hypothetical protein
MVLCRFTAIAPEEKGSRKNALGIEAVCFFGGSGAAKKT